MCPSVLVVDSDLPSAKLTRVVLEADDWRVMHAPDREHAREVLKHVLPDVIVTGLVVAHADALVLIRELKAMVGDVPVVAVTSFYGSDIEHHALSAGCAGFITKPIDVAQFSAQLRAFLGDAP